MKTASHRSSLRHIMIHLSNNSSTCQLVYSSTHINMQSIHISTVRKMLQAPEPVDIKCWAKDGRILELNNVLPLRYNFYEGTQQVKILKSNQIRTIRLCLVFEVNGIPCFL